MTLAFESAATLAGKIRDGQISSRELTDYYIGRIERFDGPLNAVPVRDFDRARDAADRHVTAIEPSVEMIRQRGASAAPVIQGYAENLPFDDNFFDASMAILTVHHSRRHGTECSGKCSANPRAKKSKIKWTLAMPRTAPLSNRNRAAPIPGCGFQVKGGSHEGLGIVGLRGIENLVGLALFHDLAVAQDDDFVGQGADHLKVVGNEQIGQTVALLQIPQQINNLGLDRDI